MTVKEIRESLNLSKNEVIQGSSVSYFNLTNLENRTTKSTKVHILAQLAKYYSQRHGFDIKGLEL